jgi:hypothetical protein
MSLSKLFLATGLATMIGAAAVTAQEGTRPVTAAFW